MASALFKKNVVLGVTGGIAAYKSAELVRLLKKQGAVVQVVMTASAQQFITPLTLATLSGNPVATQLFDMEREATISHIALADAADLVLVAPATANVLASHAQGMAPDLLGNLMLATRAPILFAPAMNVNMWNHAATQANVARLQAWGCAFVGPDEGDLACGYEGAGRMSEPTDIVAVAEQLLKRKTSRGKRS